MFAKKLSLALLACSFLSSGCIVNAADDDDSSGTDTPTTAAPTTDTPTTGDPTTGETIGETTSGASTITDTDAETTSATTGEPGGCGWGPLSGNDQVPDGYQCGIDGEIDPSGTHPIACPDAADLTPGAECTAAMVSAEGCCDANGDVWFCVDPDGDGPEETEVATEDCADPATTTGEDTDSATTGEDTDSATTGEDTDTATTGDTDTATTG